MPEWRSAARLLLVLLLAASAAALAWRAVSWWRAEQALPPYRAQAAWVPGAVLAAQTRGGDCRLNLQVGSQQRTVWLPSSCGPLGRPGTVEVEVWRGQVTALRSLGRTTPTYASPRWQADDAAAGLGLPAGMLAVAAGGLVLYRGELTPTRSSRGAST